MSSVQSLRPQLLRQVFDATLWLRAFERSGGRFGRRRRAPEEGHQSDDDDEAQEMCDLQDDAEEIDDAKLDTSKQMLENKRGEDGRDPTAEDERSDEEEEEEEERQQQQQSGRADDVIFNSAKLKQLRQIVQIGTIDAILRGKYYLAQRSDGGEVSNLREVHLNKSTSIKALDSDAELTFTYVIQG